MHKKKKKKILKVIYVKNIYIFYWDGDIYVLYVEQGEMCVSLFSTTHVTPLSVLANPSSAFAVSSPASIT